MNKNILRIFFAGMTIATLLSTPIFAEDIYPPPWRGAPGTTLAEWEFLTPNPNAPPDLQINPYGDSATFIYPGYSQEWQQEWGGSIGVWPLSGVVYIDIPNNPIANPYKDIWVQLTWATQNQTPFGMEVPHVSEITNNIETPSVLIREIPLGPTGELLPSGDTWYHSTYLIHLEPNPPREVIKIAGGIMLGELVIDTICVPEPTVCIMLAGAFVCLFGLGTRGRLFRKK
jgi:hypothetical protein